MEVLAKLGIDLSSVLIYLVNFGILLAVVAYFITGPILGVIKKRQKMIAENVAEADRIKNEFMEEKRKADQEKEALRAQMEQQMNDLKKELDLRRKAQEEEMELKKAKMLEEVRSLVEEEKQQILNKAEKQTLDLIEKVVLHVVSNKVPQDVVKGSVEEAWKSFRQ